MEWRNSSGKNGKQKQPQPCRFFTKAGACRYGSNCKFSHSISASTQQDLNRGKVQDKRDGFIQWRYMIPVQPHHTQPLGQRLSSFVKTALQLVAMEPGIMQEVVLALNSEGGFLRLKELFDQDFASMSAAVGMHVVTNQLLPFFRLVTHVNVATSIMLEDKLGSIYNFVYGRQGKRGANVFEHIRDVMAITQSTELRSSETLESVLAAFSSMIDINTHSLTNDRLPPIAEALSDISRDVESHGGSQLHKLALRIERRLGIAHSIQSTESQPLAATIKATFVLPQDLPGSRSPLGPRHDNDYADIRDIEILPTFDEIKAVRSPYLPSRSPSEWHVPGIEGLFDRHFRLLREDTVGQLRDAIAAELDQGHGAIQNAARTFTYHNLAITGFQFSRWKGLQLVIKMDQLHHLQNATLHKRQEWWDMTNRLQVGALVCLVSSHNSIIFCTVADRSAALGASTEMTTENSVRRLTVYNDPKHCYLQLQLLSANSTNVANVLTQFERPTTDQRLVEFPGVLLPSFLPTLEALKEMSCRKDLPFVEILAPEHGVPYTSNLLGPPAYALRPGFSFDLYEVMKGTLSMTFTIGETFDLSKFKRNTQLDDAQADALIDYFQRSFALIQGPPGTGKSYTGIALIKVLLDVKEKARLGPILCVCYNNHAFDQLLEGLVHHGVSQIIRIGSRSKSEVLESCNLREVVNNMDLTGPEKKTNWTIRRDLEVEERQIQDLLRTIENIDSSDVVKSYLEANHYHHYIQLFDPEDDVDNEGFQAVFYGQNDELRDWLKGHCFHGDRNAPTRSLAILKREYLYGMHYSERQVLYRFWLQDIRETLHEKLIIAIGAHELKKSELENIRQEQNLRCLQAANIIGVTTSGLGRQLNLLRNVRSKVLVCEEAGEVLEAHVLTALLPSIEHAILIGDHLQLPPHVQNYGLSRENRQGEHYSLDVSMFERLITASNERNALPYSTLEIQRRMHPSISNLIRSTLYPQLQDSPHVEDYPRVVGMKRRLFWFDHREPEAGQDRNQLATTSHSNEFEVGMTVALVTHLVRQGTYAANEIAILTPYLGQLHQIRKVLRNQFEITMSEGDVEEMQRQGIGAEDQNERPPGTIVAKTALLKALAVSTIDNFQGEEAKIVIISLVRSNAENKCGFLRTPNRINVLLSRAKHGMYIIGNSETSGHVPMWADVIGLLKSDGNFGPQLELQCTRHPETTILVAIPDDFLIFSPEGGCDRKCNKRLDCGHHDQSKCHSSTLHNAVKCLEPCTRQLKDCDHGCPNFCGEQCISRCQIMMTDIEAKLECGHTKTQLPCWQTRDLDAVRCQTATEKIIPGCEHTVTLDCHVNTLSEHFRCNAVCGTVLKCGHVCQKQCHQCRTRIGSTVVDTSHGKCDQVCGAKFNSCSHYCQLACHGDKPCECRAEYENSCEHSKCGRRCTEPCAPCASTTCTAGQCSHTSTCCSMPCAAPCDWLPCARRCEKLLICGHQCPTVCGEPCPSPKYCQKCADQDIKDNVVDFILLSTYGEADLDEDPCIIPNCGHILTVSSMDGQMEMSKHYHMEGNIATDIKHNSEPFSMKEAKVCSTCRGSLRSISRYGRIVRRALLDESTKKFIRWAGLQTIALTGSLHQEQQKLKQLPAEEKPGQLKKTIAKLEGNQFQQVEVIRKKAQTRYKTVTRLRNRIVRHLERVKIEEQPYQRVWDLIKHVNRNVDDLRHAGFDTSVLQTRETIQVSSLLIRCEIVMLFDFLEHMGEAELEVDLSENLRGCKELIQLALDANQPLHAVEGLIFYAQYCAAQRKYVQMGKVNELTVDAKNHIGTARSLCEEYPGSTRRAISELDAVDKMLKDSTLYTPMLDNEWSDVMKAMSSEFRGRGHWYRCANGHAFTIGECGMPMQQARCPQCDAPIGGQNHQIVAGVTHANDLEERFGGMHL